MTFNPTWVMSEKKYHRGFIEMIEVWAISLKKLEISQAKLCVSMCWHTHLYALESIWCLSGIDWSWFVQGNIYLCSSVVQVLILWCYPSAFLKV